jgi:hypothetical protein
MLDWLPFLKDDSGDAIYFDLGGGKFARSERGEGGEGADVQGSTCSEI